MYTDKCLVIGIGTLVSIVIPSGRFGRIEDVVVAEGYRGHGIGREITKRLITEARELELQRVDLTSHPTREAANKLYAALGFVKRDTNLYRLAL